MMIRYFIDYPFGEATVGYLPIGVWMHNPADGEVDIYYPELESPECKHPNRVINRPVEGNIKSPQDFLEIHLKRADYREMREAVKKAEIDLGNDELANQIPVSVLGEETDAVHA